LVMPAELTGCHALFCRGRQTKKNLKSRNRRCPMNGSSAYEANEIYQDILNQYFFAFKSLSERLKLEQSKEEN
ncbi:MAG TPA: hypothetical protein PLD70_11635, partial [Thermotogota bacterium]|nr:hypothetical protein [Thermotogota bacterium]